MAQCQGTTRKGDRCKRDAQDGSEYCAIHVDQAVRAPKAREVVEWNREMVMAAALGFALIGAIVLFRIRR
jgi:predicted nucleic acid-binding Zn ribbon protein